MRLPILAAALLCAALALPTAATATPAGWDATELVIPDGATDFISVGPVGETSADGAIWVAWCETPSGDPTRLVARRISPDGEVGAVRVLSTTVPGGFNCTLALSRVGADAMRIAYLDASGDRLDLRRLTPSATGAATVVYDRAVDDGDGADNNGPVGTSPLQLLAGPGDTAWVFYRRVNSYSLPVLEARLVASDDILGPVATVSPYAYEAAAAVNPVDGSLVTVIAGGSQGLTVAVPVSTGATVGGTVVLRESNPPLSPPSSPFAGTSTPAIGIDASGIATTGWMLDVNGAPRILQARRLNANTMTTVGGAPVSLNDGLVTDYNQYGPLIAVTPGGATAAGWYETTSFSDSNNAIVRAFAPGNLEDVGVVKAKQQLDEVGRAASVSDLIPGSGDLVTAFEFGADLNSQAAGCRVATLDASTGGLVGAPEQLAPGNCYATGPSDDAYGLFAAWDGTDGALRLLRKPGAAPVCSDGPPVSVAAGASVTLELPCTGWRPQRVVTTAPAKGTLGAVDQAAGTVTYTAGAAGGTDTVGFKASNGAGDSAGASVSVMVTTTPGGGSPGGASPGGSGPAGAGDPDVTAPVLSGVSVSPRSLARKARRGPAVRFTLSERAVVTMTVERQVPGRRSGSRCVRPGSKRAGARCVRSVRVRRTVTTLAGGAGTLAIGLKRGASGLPAGAYRVTLAARDAASNAGRAVVATFRVR